MLLVRHALPHRSEPGQGSDPDLCDEGREQAARLPDALARYPITRVISSPQRRVVSDNLRKGAATNAVQIAEVLLERDLVRASAEPAARAAS